MQTIESGAQGVKCTLTFSCACGEEFVDVSNIGISLIDSWRRVQMCCWDFGAIRFK
jgi:hypothetical protein